MRLCDDLRHIAIWFTHTNVSKEFKVEKKEENTACVCANCNQHHFNHDGFSKYSHMCMHSPAIIYLNLQSNFPCMCLIYQKSYGPHTTSPNGFTLTVPLFSYSLFLLIRKFVSVLFAEEKEKIKKEQISKQIRMGSILIPCGDLTHIRVRVNLCL